MKTVDCLVTVQTIVKSLKPLYALLALIFLILSIWGASCKGRQNERPSNSKTPASSPPSIEQPSPQNASSGSAAQVQVVMDEEQTRGWKTYRYPSGETFRYPQYLVLSRRGNLVRLRHSIRFKHIDPCDYSDEHRTLSSLVDFDVSFELTSK